jgi:hypothetical protein
MTEANEPIHRKAIEAEVNSTIKLVMSVMEELATQEPQLAAQPLDFNERRHVVIRKIWNLAKECIRYGAVSV